MGYVRLSESDARRVAAATRAYERGNRDMAPIKFREPGGDGDPIRIGKVSADWAFGTCATVTIWESGTSCTPGVNSPAETIENVRNLAINVASGSWVAIARAANGYWYLVEAGSSADSGSCKKTIGGEDVTKFAGWDGTKLQLLGHDENGCLKWFDNDDCEETTGP